MDEIDAQIEQLLVTWDEDEAQALWESLGDPEPRTSAPGEPPPLTPIKPVALPSGKRPPQDIRQAGTRRVPAIACLKAPPSARAAERKRRELMGEQPSPPRPKPAKTTVRPVSWALPQKPHRAGDDSAASGRSTPNTTSKVNPATFGLSGDRRTSTLKPHRAGDDSAASGNRQPKKRPREVNPATSGVSLGRTPPVLAPHQSGDKPALSANHIPKPRIGNNKGHLARPAARLEGEAMETASRPKFNADVPGVPTRTGNLQGEQQTATQTGPSNRAPRGKTTISPTPAYRCDGKPPVRVPISAGRIIEVPYHAAHISRKYRIFLSDGLWRFRFSTTGRLLSSRRA